MIVSQSAASSQPGPNALPLTRATVGIVLLCSSSKTVLVSLAASNNFALCASESLGRSTPAQKARSPAPVRTTRAGGCLMALRRAPVNCSSISVVRLLSGGRSRISQRMFLCKRIRRGGMFLSSVHCNTIVTQETALDLIALASEAILYLLKIQLDG